MHIMKKYNTTSRLTHLVKESKINTKTDCIVLAFTLFYSPERVDIVKVKITVHLQTMDGQSSGQTIEPIDRSLWR